MQTRSLTLGAPIGALTVREGLSENLVSNDGGNNRASCIMVHMGPTRTTLTFEEFESLPDRPGKQELLTGELIDSPPATVRSSRITHRIYEQLKAALNQAHTRGEALDLG